MQFSKKELIEIIKDLPFNNFCIEFVFKPEEPKIEEILPIQVDHYPCVTPRESLKENLEMSITSQRILIPDGTEKERAWTVVKDRYDLRL